jgi:hypothetical protein
MKNFALFRRRFIPDEIIHLKGDEILFFSKDIIITKWKTLKPRIDFTDGYSCYFTDYGYKVSKFYNGEEFLYTYCDIIETEFHEDRIIFNDLLVDVVITKEGFVKVLDLGEISVALDKKLITQEQAKKALNITDELLSLIYSGNLEKLLKPFEHAIKH